MKKQFWIIAMAIATVAALGSPEIAHARSEACQPDGGHVVESKCESNCCAGFCGACHIDGHGICGHGSIE